MHWFVIVVMLTSIEQAPMVQPLPLAKPVETGLPTVNAQPLEMSAEEEANVRVYQLANKSVVHINTKAIQADEFLPFNVPRQGSGSGSVLTKQGHILTNYHVVEEAQVVNVTLADGASHQAKLVGTDPNNDLAVLKIDADESKLFPIAWGDSTKLLVGLRVFAIGNPFGLERTLTTGIVSSLGRTLRSDNNRIIRGVIQTDAAINPGNSGGPLLNRRGELIGINTAIVARAGQSSGIGLAVPANTARRVVDELIRNGRIVRPELGIATGVEGERGLLVIRLTPGSPAERAGVKGPEERVVQKGAFLFRTIDRSKADLITAVDGVRVKTLDDLLTHVEAKKPGDKVTLSIVRDGREMSLEIELERAKN